MKKFVLAVFLVLLIAILSGCELTLAKTTTEYDKKSNTIKRTTTLLPDIDKQLEDIFGK